MADDMVLYYGDSIKSLDDGRVGGYLVRFSDESDTDLEGDFFTKDTDFGEAKSTPIWFHHRQKLPTKDGGFIWIKEKIGDGEIEIDDDGVFVSAVLYNRDRYEKVLQELGWSSGTAQHLVERKSFGNASMITHWPLGLDASLTPTPAEPYNKAISLKMLSTGEADTDPVDIEESEQVEPEASQPEGDRSSPALAGKSAEDSNDEAARKLLLEIELLELED